MGGSTTNQKIFPIFIKHHFLHVGILPSIDGFKDAESAFRGLRDTVGEARILISSLFGWGFCEGCIHPTDLTYIPWRGVANTPGSQWGCQPGVWVRRLGFASLKFTPRGVPNGWHLQYAQWGCTRWQPLPLPPQSKFYTMAKNDMTAEISNSSVARIKEEVINI